MFRDWLDLMLYALQRRDDPYLEIVNQYSNDRPDGEREADYFAEAFSQLQQGMAATDADLLGVIYEAYGHSNDAFGQYFTPGNVCRMMAEMNLDITEPEQYTESNPLTVADPACGSGRLLVHTAKKTPEKVEHAVYCGQDKDPMCAKMTALNLCFFNLDGYVVLGDSFRVEARRLWETQSTFMGGEVRELNPDEVGNPFEQTLQANMEEQAAEEPDSEERRVSMSVDDLDEVDVDLRQATFEEYGK